MITDILKTAFDMGLELLDSWFICLVVAGTLLTICVSVFLDHEED